MIFLDTDIMIDFFRRYPSALGWLDDIGKEEVGLSGFVVMELIQGCQNKKEQGKLEKVLSDYQIIWPSDEVCDQALWVFARYHLSHSLGLLDALIAQAAISLGVPLCTFNEKHYACIPGLTTKQPYSKG